MARGSPRRSRSFGRSASSRADERPNGRSPLVCLPRTPALAMIAEMVRQWLMLSVALAQLTACAHVPLRRSTSPAVSMPLELVHGIAITTLVVEGRSRRLMFDTGTADLLLLEAPPGDAPLQEVHDALGSTIRFAPGSVNVTWEGGDESTVPVWRTE